MQEAFEAFTWWPIERQAKTGQDVSGRRFSPGVCDAGKGYEVCEAFDWWPIQGQPKVSPFFRADMFPGVCDRERLRIV